jgi:hypothetical protein
MFQTKTDNLDLYIQELSLHIDIFMYHVSKMSARWSNKPKYHILKHLPKSVKRFGLPCLFASEKFEAYKSVLRNASVHSNRHSPGRDIANTFSNYEVMRSILSGASMYDVEKRFVIQSSEKVSEVFEQDVEIQQLMGLNPGKPRLYPSLRLKRVPENQRQGVPSLLSDGQPNKKFKQIQSIEINEYEHVEIGTYVLVRSN